MHSSVEGIDGNGFRNIDMLETAEIVALGDSHTYGNNVGLEESWPQQLAKMANLTAYNFGVGGYGSLQYHYLLQDAVALGPKYIVLGLYIANDLSDVCVMIREMEYWQEWAKMRGYDIGPCLHSSMRLENSSKQLTKLLFDLVTQTAVGSLMALVQQRASEKIGVRSAVVVKEESNPTIISHKRIAAHKTYMDMDQEEISLGFEITKDIIGDAKIKSDLNNISFSVALIPSKERVFFDYLIDKDYELPEKYRESVDNEMKLVNRFLRLFGELGIEAVDVKPNVLRELYKSDNVYTQSDDGHPGRIGYKAYAEAIYASILN
jgi:lysophospholipase L1-like esterase